MKVEQVIECPRCKWRITMTGSNNLKKLGGPPTWDMPSLKASYSMMAKFNECRFCNEAPTRHAVTELEAAN